jgi:hypothetical protein
MRTRKPPRGRPAFGETQRAAILRLLGAARGAWVPLPEILALGIAQYGARILEARRMGFRIENRTERLDGVCHSWFPLLSSNPSDWYTTQTGKPQPVPPHDFGPLIETVADRG